MKFTQHFIFWSNSKQLPFDNSETFNNIVGNSVAVARFTADTEETEQDTGRPLPQRTHKILSDSWI
ncbi:hypothetical protein EYF80_018898 [Liparis tanakae]|uniref:Uncharacterized protein n=1 Tax=Liparis tanakae TaxID=230148 RepID=A0A4Z2I115_9TELE|nr:hypothetical protein EYF80_018898 [Liparis tanakae]